VFRGLRGERRTKHADAHFELAVLYERRHRVDEAEAAVARVLKLNANYFEAWLMRGRLLQRRGETQQAAGMFRRLALTAEAHIITRPSVGCIGFAGGQARRL